MKPIILISVDHNNRGDQVIILLIEGKREEHTFHEGEWIQDISKYVHQLRRAG